MTAKQKLSERKRRLIELWLERPANERTRNHVLVFYGWLRENRPELLWHGHGDPYQYLQVDLATHIRE